MLPVSEVSPSRGSTNRDNKIQLGGRKVGSHQRSCPLCKHTTQNTQVKGSFFSASYRGNPGLQVYDKTWPQARRTSDGRRRSLFHHGRLTDRSKQHLRRLHQGLATHGVCPTAFRRRHGFARIKQSLQWASLVGTRYIWMQLQWDYNRRVAAVL